MFRGGVVVVLHVVCKNVDSCNSNIICITYCQLFYITVGAPVSCPESLGVL